MVKQKSEKDVFRLSFFAYITGLAEPQNCYDLKKKKKLFFF